MRPRITVPYDKYVWRSLSEESSRLHDALCDWRRRMWDLGWISRDELAESIFALVKGLIEFLKRKSLIHLR